MKQFILMAIYMVAASTSYGQGMQGKKVLTTTAAFSNLSIYRNKVTDGNTTLSETKGISFDIRPDVTYGRVNSTNLLIAYGLSLGIGHSKTETMGLPNTTSNFYSVGPLVMAQKFINITERLYFAPAARLAADYSYTKYSNNPVTVKRYSGSLTIQPLSVAFNIKPKANVLLLIGDISARYFRYDNTDQGNGTVVDQKINQFSVTGNFNVINVGYQILL